MAFRSLLVLSYLACQRLDADIPRHPQLGAGGQRLNHLACLELAGINGVLPAVLGDSQSMALAVSPDASVGSYRSTLRATRPAPPPATRHALRHLQDKCA